MNRGRKPYFRGKKTGKTACILRREVKPPGLVPARFLLRLFWAFGAVPSQLPCQAVQRTFLETLFVIGRSFLETLDVIGRTFLETLDVIGRSFRETLDVIGRASHGPVIVIGRASHGPFNRAWRCLITWAHSLPSAYRTLGGLFWARLITWTHFGLSPSPDPDPQSVFLAGFHARTTERPRRSTRPCPGLSMGAESARARGRPYGVPACGKPVDTLWKAIGLSVSRVAFCGVFHISSSGFPQDIHRLSTGWPFL